eukprot:gene1529-4679_t
MFWWLRLGARLGPFQQVVTRYTKVLLLPATVLVGFIGSRVEETVRKDAMERDVGAPPAWQRRSKRELDELSER